MDERRFWDRINGTWPPHAAEMMAIYWEKCHELYKKLRDSDVIVEIPDEYISRVISGVIWRGQIVYESVMMLPGRVLDGNFDEFYDFHATLPQSWLDNVDEEFPWE